MYILVYSQGVVKTINVNKMIQAGCKVKIWIADWFAQLNNKMGGDLKKIQTVGRYMIEIWKAAGMNLDGVEFLWSSEEINKRAHEYWPLVMDIARKNNVKRITRYMIFYCIFLGVLGYPLLIKLEQSGVILFYMLPTLNHSTFHFVVDVVKSWVEVTRKN